MDAQDYIYAELELALDRYAKRIFMSKFSIMQNSVLHEISKVKPSTHIELLSIAGFPEVSAESSLSVEFLRAIKIGIAQHESNSKTASICACGMGIQKSEYHPAAACIIFSACKDASLVLSLIHI